MKFNRLFILLTSVFALSSLMACEQKDPTPPKLSLSEVMLRDISSEVWDLIDKGGKLRDEAEGIEREATPTLLLEKVVTPLLETCEKELEEAKKNSTSPIVGKLQKAEDTLKEAEEKLKKALGNK